jgi:uncharacterized delta-60 repeat protein
MKFLFYYYRMIVLLVLSVLTLGKCYAQSTQEWEASYGNSVVPRAMAVDGDGNMYITGYGFTSGQGYNFLTVKFNSSGEKEWDVKFNGTTNNDDYARYIALDKDGNIYVAGIASTGSSNSTNDIAIVKYNSAGEEQWSAIFNGESNGFDSPTAVAVDASGNVYVTGISVSSNGTEDYVTIKYNSTGDEQWKSFYNGPGNSDDEAIAIALDDQNNIYITGRSKHGSFGSTFDIATIKYNNSGEEQWVARYDGPANDVDAGVSAAVDGSGNVYVTGVSTGSGTLYDYATIKYNSNGEEQWVKIYNGDANREDTPVKILLDGSGNIYVTGQSRKSSSFDSEDYATVKYNSSGDELWVKRFDGDASSSDIPIDLKIDDENNIYVTGYSETGSGAVTKDICTIKYRPDGSEDWIVFYNNSENTGDEPVGIGLDNLGNIYVAGSSKFAYLALKYGQVTDVEQTDSNIPGKFSLLQNYPNPFNPNTTIEFSIPDANQTTITIYNSIGQEVMVLLSDYLSSGSYRINFSGENLSSGVYFYRLEVENFVSTKKMILMK